MSETERQINILIAKIYNWSEQTANVALGLSLHSQRIGALLIQKNIRASCASNQLILNCALKINYTPEQNIIVLRLDKYESKGTASVIAQIDINLDSLGDRRNHYLPCGFNDLVLQISAYESTYSQYRPLKGVKFERGRQGNQHFIRDRERFLKKASRAIRVNYGEQQSALKKSFSQKVYNLLSQVKSLKNSQSSSSLHRAKLSQRLYREQKTYQNSNKYSGISIQQNLSNKMSQYSRVLAKSHSEDMIFLKKKQYEDPIRETVDTGSKSQASLSYLQQRHRLILSNLDVVACQEYLDTSSERMPQIFVPSPKHYRSKLR